MIQTNPHRILAMVPGTRGIAFAVFDDDTLVDWGLKSVKGDKEKVSIHKVKELLSLYNPAALVLEDTLAKDCRRSFRVRGLIAETATLARTSGTRVTFISRARVKNTLVPGGAETKHEIAQFLAARFPQELGDQLPPKRKPWETENYWMAVFEAVGLAFGFATQKEDA